MIISRIDEHTVLQLLEVKHAEKVYQLIHNNLEHLGKWLSFANKYYEVKHAILFIENALQQYFKQNGMQCGIYYKNELAGCIGFNEINKMSDSAEIGYWLGKKYEGQGTMTSCSRSLIQYAFDELNLNRVEIRVGTENVKSRAIPERLHFVQEGIFRQKGKIRESYYDIVMYGMLASEWKKEHLF